jgi:hypothetical protein
MDVFFVTPAVEWMRGGETDQGQAARLVEGRRAQSPGGERSRRSRRQLEPTQLELGAQELKLRRAQELERRLRTQQL